MKIFYKKIIDKFFEWAMMLKALLGFLEISAGFLFMLGGQKIINSLILMLADQEVADDPQDVLAKYILKVAGNFSHSTQVFAIFYLLFHGLVNIILPIFMLKNRIWSYLVAIVLFGVFDVYQIYRFFHTYSLFLLFLIILDIFIILAIWLEYNKILKNNHKK